MEYMMDKNPDWNVFLNMMAAVQVHGEWRTKKGKKYTTSSRKVCGGGTSVLSLLEQRCCLSHNSP